MKTNAELRELVAKCASTAKEAICLLIPDQSNPTCSQIVRAIEQLCKNPHKIQNLESTAAKVKISITPLQELIAVWNGLKPAHHDFAWHQITSKYEIYLCMFKALQRLFEDIHQEPSSSAFEAISSKLSQDIAGVHNRYWCLQEEGGNRIESPAKSTAAPPLGERANSHRKDGDSGSPKPEISVSQLDESSLIFDLIVEYVEAISFFSQLVRKSSKKNGNHLVALAIRKC